MAQDTALVVENTAFWLMHPTVAENAALVAENTALVAQSGALLNKTLL